MENSVKRLNTAVIGFGLSGRVFHAPIIAALPDFCLSKVYTSDPEKGKTCKSLYPETLVVQDVNEIFRDQGIDLVIVATPNTSHFSFAREALLAGKHVVVEKPFTITSEEADELITLARQQQRVLSVYQNRRWDGDFKTVKKVIESGILGNLAEYESHFDRFRNTLKENAWREEDLPGSGMLYDLGAHLVDQALVLFGLPREVTADLRIQRQGGRVIDNFEILLHYDDVKVTLKSGMLVKEPLPRFILLGDKGSFVKYGTDVQEGDLALGYTPLTKRNWGEEPGEQSGILNASLQGMNFRGRVESEKGDYREFYRNIHQAVIQGIAPAVTAVQARNTIRVIELAAESSRLKRTVEFNKMG